MARVLPLLVSGSSKRGRLRMRWRVTAGDFCAKRDSSSGSDRDSLQDKEIIDYLPLEFGQRNRESHQVSGRQWPRYLDAYVRDVRQHGAFNTKQISTTRSACKLKNLEALSLTEKPNWLIGWHDLSLIHIPSPRD